MSIRFSGKFAGSALTLTCLASFVLAQDDLKSSIERANCYQGVRFDSIHGTVTVVLPTDLSVGSTISGTVLVSPKGNSEKEKSVHQKALAGMSILVLGTSLSGSPSQFSVKVPESPAVTIVTGNAQSIAQRLDTIPKFNPFEGMTPRTPNVAKIGDPITVLGSFDGNSANTSVAFGAKQGIVLAESPNSLVLMPVEAKPGPCAIRIQDGAKALEVQTNMIGLRLQIPRTRILKGERLTLNVEVSGLERLSGAEFPLVVQLNNLTPDTIQLQGGNNQSRPILQNDVHRSGSMNWSVPLVGLTQGDFTIKGVLPTPAFPWPGYYPRDVDRPIPMDGNETAAELDRYTIRRLMDTLRDLRARKWHDLANSRESQKFLKDCLRKVKAALKRKGVDVPDEPIDDVE